MRNIEIILLRELQLEMEITSVGKVVFVGSVGFKSVALHSFPTDVPFLFIEVGHVL